MKTRYLVILVPVFATMACSEADKGNPKSSYIEPELKSYTISKRVETATVDATRKALMGERDKIKKCLDEDKDFDSFMSYKTTLFDYWPIIKELGDEEELASRRNYIEENYLDAMNTAERYVKFFIRKRKLYDVDGIRNTVKEINQAIREEGFDIGEDVINSVEARILSFEE